MSRLQFFAIPILVLFTVVAFDLVDGVNFPLFAVSAEHRSPASQSDSQFHCKLCSLPSGWKKNDAKKVLHAAAQRFDRRKMKWLEMDIWQRASFEDLRYEIDGKYQVAPGGRLRLELQLRNNPANAKVVCVCQGEELQESIIIRGKPANIRKVSLASPTRKKSDEAGSPDVRESLFKHLDFRGVGPLLAMIRRRIQNPILETVENEGKELYRIRGRWPVSKKSGKPSAELEETIRECCVYLDEKTLWPARIEWWGSKTAAAGNRLLLQTEYRNPEFNRPLPLDRLAGTFALIES